MQNYARKYKIEIDSIAFDFEFMQMDPTDYEKDIYMEGNIKFLERPLDGAYISGLYIEGARWDMRDKILSESYPKRLNERMPMIWLRPTVIQKA